MTSTYICRGCDKKVAPSPTALCYVCWYHYLRDGAVITKRKVCPGCGIPPGHGHTEECPTQTGIAKHWAEEDGPLVTPEQPYAEKEAPDKLGEYDQKLLWSLGVTW